MEARLIKDLLPKYNRELRDNKTFPYLEIHTHEDYPRVEITRTPQARGVKLYGPFAKSAVAARGAASVAEDLQVPHLLAGHPAGRRRAGGGFAPACWPPWANARRPCNFRISREEYRKNIHRLQTVPGGQEADRCWARLRRTWPPRPPALRFEEAARLRDEIHLLETLNERGELDTHVQPEVFPVDPKKGLAGLQQGAAPGASGRGRSRASTSPTPAGSRHRGQRGAVHRRAALQAGLQAAADPQRGGRRRRGQHPRGRAAAVPPPGRERGHARHPPDRRRQGAVARGRRRPWRAWRSTPRPTVLSLAKREELIFRAGAGGAAAAEPSRLRLAAVAIRPRRGPSLRPALSPHPPPPLDAGRIRRRAEGGSRLGSYLTPFRPAKRG